MSIINCSECNSEVSDKAITCPKCGAPTHSLTHPNESKQVWGIASLILGIGSVTLPYFAIVFLVPTAIILGAIAIQKSKDKLGFIGLTLGLVGAAGIFHTSYQINTLFSSITGKKAEVNFQYSESPKTQNVTLIKYNQIRDRMSYSDINAIVGAIGTQISSTDIGGESMEMYSWQNEDGSSITAMFQNDILQSKSQFGLR